MTYRKTYTVGRIKVKILSEIPSLISWRAVSQIIRPHLSVADDEFIEDVAVSIGNQVKDLDENIKAVVVTIESISDIEQVTVEVALGS